MQLIPLKRSQKRQLQKIYANMKDGSELCDLNCHKCCIEGVKLTYIEFAFLVDNLTEKEIVDIFNKPRKLRDDEKYFLCPILNDSGRCSRYDNRSWVCRAYRKDLDLGSCVQKPLEEVNKKAAKKILQLNNTLDIPSVFKDYSRPEELTIRDFFEILVEENEGSGYLIPSLTIFPKISLISPFNTDSVSSSTFGNLLLSLILAKELSLVSNAAL
ncbi:MAG: hypothetical protein GTN36_04175 [Candidatus Aenigmarchaeota archaeon]|nr:hypothetical protein [Candidatus Aenigmarchaeota archaeon]